MGGRSLGLIARSRQRPGWSQHSPEPLRPMFKKILLILAVLNIGFVIVVLTRPADFRVSRNAAMAAPPEWPISRIFLPGLRLRNWASASATMARFCGV